MLGVLGAGVLGDVVLLDEPLVLGEVVLLPDVLPELMLPELLGVLDVPPELEPDLLKCASHSEREIEPSLLVSTAEKLGAALLLAEAPLLPDAPVEALPDVDCDALGAELPLEDMPDEPLPEDDWLEPVAAGDEDDGVLLDDEDCATASVDSANSTAAVMVVAVLNIGTFLLKEVGKTAPTRYARQVPAGDLSSPSRQ